jgi:hypothetical protein
MNTTTRGASIDSLSGTTMSFSSCYDSDDDNLVIVLLDAPIGSPFLSVFQTKYLWVTLHI